MNPGDLTTGAAKLHKAWQKLRLRWEAPLDRGSLWAGLFDLRENLLGCALDDLRALAG